MKRIKNSGLGIVNLISFIFVVSLLVLLFNEIKNNSEKVVIEENKKAEVVEKKEIEEEKIEEPIIEEKKEEPKKEETPVVKQEPVINHYTTRMTSFWPAENDWENKCTASGLCMDHMTENEYGWYMYQGKLAIATASTRLGNSSQKTYKLYQEVKLVIYGKTYPAIVIDVCGACQKYNRIDLYVKDGAHSIDTNVEIYY